MFSWSMALPRIILNWNWEETKAEQMYLSKSSRKKKKRFLKLFYFKIFLLVVKIRIFISENNPWKYSLVFDDQSFLFSCFLHCQIFFFRSVDYTDILYSTISIKYSHSNIILPSYLFLSSQNSLLILLSYSLYTILS